MLLDALNFFVRILFPACCGICGKLNKNWICENCYNSLERLKIKECKKENQNHNLNKDKKSKENLSYIFGYKGIIRNLIIKYKFNNNAYLSNLFAEVILKDDYYLKVFNNYDYIIPVPCIKKRRNKEDIIKQN